MSHRKAASDSNGKGSSSGGSASGRKASRTEQKRSQRTNYRLEEQSMSDDHYDGDRNIFDHNSHSVPMYTKPTAVINAANASYNSANFTAGGVDFAKPAHTKALSGTATKYAKKRGMTSSASKDGMPTALNPGVFLEFQSATFNSNLFRLRQSGILILDLRGKDSEKLTKEEAIYCIQHATTLFCPVISAKIMEVMIQYFTGNKLVLCGGVSVLQNATIFSELLHEYLIQRSAKLTSDRAALDAIAADFAVANQGITSSQAQLLQQQHGDLIAASGATLSLNISELFMTAQASLKLARCLSLNSYVCLRELAIDSVSVGVLGVALVLMSMKSNKHLEALIVKCAPYDTLPSFADSIREMHVNENLRELRIFGVVLSDSILTEGVLYAVQNGWRKLQMLEFSAAPTSRDATDSIIRAAKARLTLPPTAKGGGMSGISVTVNSG